MLKAESKSRSHALFSILGDTVQGGNYQKVVNDLIFQVEGLRLEKEDGPPGGPYRDR